MDITKQELQSLRDLILKAANDAVPPGYMVVSTSGKYGYMAQLVLEITKADQDGKIRSAVEMDFETYAVMYGLEKADLGARFTERGETYQISGLSLKSRKYPVLAKNVNTKKTYKFMINDILRAKKAGKPYWQAAS